MWHWLLYVHKSPLHFLLGTLLEYISQTPLQISMVIGTEFSPMQYGKKWCLTLLAHRNHPQVLFSLISSPADKQNSENFKVGRATRWKKHASQKLCSPGCLPNTHTEMLTWIRNKYLLSKTIDIWGLFVIAISLLLLIHTLYRKDVYICQGHTKEGGSTSAWATL